MKPKRTIHAEQSLAGAVREQLDIIERKVKNGIRLKKIHAEFIAVGHSKSFKNFESALYRARKRSRQPGTEALTPTAGHVDVPAPVAARVEAAVAPAITPPPAPVPAAPAPAAGPAPDYFKRTPLIGKTQ